MDEERRRQEREAALDPENRDAALSRELSESRIKPRRVLDPSPIMIPASWKNTEKGVSVVFYEESFVKMRPYLKSYKVMIYNGIMYHQDKWTLTEEGLDFYTYQEVLPQSEFWFI